MLALAACAGGDGSSSGGQASSSTAPPPSSTAGPTFTGDEGSPFCRLLDGVDLGVVDRAGGEPAALAQAFTTLVDVLVEAARLAPPEIRVDVTLVAEGMTAFDAALAAVGYDVVALSESAEGPEVAAAVNDPAFAEAGERLAAYRQQVCGL